jgi:peptidoglycan/xylan/chitin deacetylase (PgdA/CDA1 family)
VFSQSGSRLFIFNYHRLRPTAGSPSAFDDGVFDTEVGTFRRQMEWLRRETIVLDEEGLLTLNEKGRARDGAIYSAVTFDDGYIDCLTLAKPILDEFGIRGLFFIPFQMIESRQLGWWDLASNLLKRTSRKFIEVDGVHYDISSDLPAVQRSILNRFKLEPAEKTSTLLERLAAACDVSLATPDEQSAELMTWADIRGLSAAGHAIGAHSMTHRVLATLDPTEQAREIRDSGRNLETVLGHRVASFAYPVGGLQHINQHSVRLVRESGYSQAFTFNTGVASLPCRDQYKMPRESARSYEIMRAKVLLPTLMGLSTDAGV